MQKVILINGNGGAGKRTTAQLLYSRLARSSWTHMRWMAALKTWEPTSRFDDLILRNAAAIIQNYLDEGVDTAIFSGGIFTQEHLERFIDLVSRPVEVLYFWLDVPDELRAKRLIIRGRDSGDLPESVATLVPNYSHKPTPLTNANGFYRVLEAGNRSPMQLVDEIIESL